MKFEDIIDHPHHVSKTRLQQPLMARAAQFSPFAALTGYDDEVQETARLTDMFAVMTEDQSAVLDDAFQRMLEMDRPKVTIRYFKPDSRKEGGSYQEYSGTFRFYDVGSHILKFTDGMEISTEMVCGIEIE